MEQEIRRAGLLEALPQEMAVGQQPLPDLVGDQSNAIYGSAAGPAIYGSTHSTDPQPQPDLPLYGDQPDTYPADEPDEEDPPLMGGLDGGPSKGPTPKPPHSAGPGGSGTHSAGPGPSFSLNQGPSGR